jgi:chromosome segregation protein
MFLRSLTLKGFKSFADATTLTYEPGVSVVVGPNGSGKSNVVDAIAWVLGAQAPSAVRSQRMDDVIFAGTAKRPALGRAEVSLTIDNSAGLLPIEFTEVTVSRILFRTGESEYAVNGVPCRLLDVQELLSDAGVGRQQHVIVSQGQIDAVLNARPEERRQIVEEAAGVLKFRKRKEKAERRLEATEGSLLRVQDLLREVRRQLRPLERQAEAARRHGELDAELTALRLHLAGREITGLRTRLATLATDRHALTASEQDVKSELARLDADVLATEARLSAAGGADLGDDLARAEQLRERGRGLAAVLGERRRGLAGERDRLAEADARAGLLAEQERLEAERDDVVEAALALDPDRLQLDADTAALAADRAAFEATEIDAGGDTPAGRVVGAAAEVRGELRTLRASVAQAEADAGRLVTRRGQLHERAERLDAEIDRLRAECEAAEDAERPLAAALEAAEARRQTLDEAVGRADATLEAARATQATWATRAEALALALDQARARAGAERLAGVDGTLGTLLELVDVDEGWAPAFEAAAGDALAAVVVDSVDGARAALAALHRGGLGGAVVALGPAGTAASPPPVGEPVRRHVRSADPAVGRLLDALVGSAVAVDGGWDVALDIAIAHPDATVVTRAGDRFGRHGWRLGSGGVGATGAALDEARTAADAAAADVIRRDADARRVRAERDAARRTVEDVVARLDQADAAFVSATDGLARVQAERREVATQTDAIRGGADDAAERLAVDQRRLAELEAALPALEAEESAVAAAARARHQARAELDERAASLTARRRQLDVTAAGLDERAAFIARRLSEVEARLAAAAEARADAAARLVVLERHLVALDRLSEIVETRRSEAAAALAELTELRRRQSDQARAVTQHLDGLRRQRADAERRLEELRERSRRCEIDDAEMRMRLEAAVEGLRRDLDCEPERAIAAPCPDLPEGTSPGGRARELERELRLLGPINPLALEEFTALQERHAFLEAQLEDVKDSRRELLRVIKAVDAEIQQVFAAAYADVSVNFTALFERLFPGGAGRLVLTEPDDLLNTGVEVEARPSGKNVKKLSLLSGGERSLTALAFLFAVFRSRPSPFYVMDEVEAALDDVNLHRFLGLIDEFRAEAQLIVVSHQKRTMEAADCLIGVTMAPGGSSRVITEKVAVG